MAATPRPAPPADDAPHLLFVDDDRRIRSLLSRYLQQRGLSRDHGGKRRRCAGKLAGLISIC